MGFTHFACLFELFVEVFTSDARVFEDYQFPLRHIIVPLLEPEYESDANHVADDQCGHCGEKAGRRGRVGKRFGDKDDRDDLLNCDGCTKAFHHDCRPYLEQDTPENRRRHRCPVDVPLTFARRYEPWL